MSWSVTLIGKPENVAKALEAEGESLTGQSKIEFDAAKPHLVALVKETFATGGYAPPIVKLTASGSGCATNSVSIEPLYAKLV